MLVVLVVCLVLAVVGWRQGNAALKKQGKPAPVSLGDYADMIALIQQHNNETLCARCACDVMQHDTSGSWNCWDHRLPQGPEPHPDDCK